VTVITADTALVPGVCRHGAVCHDGTESSAASAPANARAWLLAEHPGPWPEEATDAHLPAPLRKVVDRAKGILMERFGFVSQDIGPSRGPALIVHHVALRDVVGCVGNKWHGMRWITGVFVVGG